jgi:DNA helicase-2/ATP-dependent DNA helicase PcrA
MIERIEKFGIKKKPTIKTVHSLGLSIIKENNRKRFKVMDDNDQYVQLSILINNIKNGKNGYTKRKLKHKPFNLISLFSIFNVNRRDYSRVKMDDEEKYLFREYTKHKNKFGWITFGDMVYYGWEILKNKEILKTYKDKYKYIIVDESQDIGYALFSIIDLLASNNGNLIYVGDEKQAINESFAGSSPEFIKDFKQIYNNADVRFMPKTYRTPKRILEIANDIAIDLGNNTINTNSEKNGSINYIQYMDDADQAKQILNKIVSDKMNLEETAILMRANSNSMWFQLECIERNIPFFSKKLTFLEKGMIRTIVSYIKFINSNCKDYNSFIEIANKPNRYIRTSNIISLKKKIPKAPLIELIKNDRKAMLFVNECQRINDEGKSLLELVRAIVTRFKVVEYYAEEYEKDMMEEFIDFVSFIKSVKDVDKLLKVCDEISHNRKNKKGVRLLSIHSSKGSEFDNVFIVTCNKGVLPHANNANKMEELRLFYVGVTRTKDKLFLSSIKRRNNKSIRPSPYIERYICDE